jgi:sugar/nucleoside kinase (ribokinase family)
MAASCLTKRLAVVTKIAKSEEECMAPLKTAGIDLYLQPGEPYEARLITPNKNVDERQMFLTKRTGYFCIEDLPPLEPCLIHLGGIPGDGYEFPLEFIQKLKERGFRLSMDIQSFIWQVDNQTQALYPKDIPERQDILRMGDFVKLDVNEAKALTNTDDIQKQASILENLGSTETMITSSNGALARRKGKNYFAKFINKNILGRHGRGDTFTGAYLARRLDHSVEDSLRFAVALTSLKMEYPGPFEGSFEDVLERMRQDVNPYVSMIG